MRRQIGEANAARRSGIFSSPRGSSAAGPLASSAWLYGTYNGLAGLFQRCQRAGGWAAGLGELSTELSIEYNKIAYKSRNHGTFYTIRLCFGNKMECLAAAGWAAGAFTYRTWVMFHGIAKCLKLLGCSNVVIWDLDAEHYRRRISAGVGGLCAGCNPLLYIYCS